MNFKAIRPDRGLYQLWMRSNRCRLEPVSCCNPVLRPETPPEENFHDDTAGTRRNRSGIGAA
jgi:hypothetical protein